MAEPPSPFVTCYIIFKWPLWIQYNFALSSLSDYDIPDLAERLGSLEVGTDPVAVTESYWVCYSVWPCGNLAQTKSIMAH